MRKARGEDMACIKEAGIYKYTTIQEAKRVSGRSPIGVRWVDTDKGDRYRSRLCAKEFKWKDPWLENTFAGTPPWEAIKLVLSKALLGAKTSMCSPMRGHLAQKLFPSTSWPP